jgi:hypothetical protein
MKVEFDGGKREAIARAMTNTMVGVGGKDGHTLPATVARSMLPEAIERTGVGSQSSNSPGVGGYGSTLAIGMPDDVVDRARTTVGPLDYIRFWEIPEREYVVPITYEASMAAGQKFGGFEATF